VHDIEQPRRGRPLKRLLSITDLAFRLSVSRGTIYSRFLYAGCPHYRVGHSIRFDLDEVKAWCRRDQWDGGDDVLSWEA
jgi:excisionase family DNA binding protein